MDSLAEKVAVRYKQKGKARKKRVRQYRKNKVKSRAQNKHWRNQHPLQTKLYRRKRDRNPRMHELRRRASMLVDPAALLPIHFWDTKSEVVGQVRSVALDGTFIDAVMGDTGFVETYDLDEFLEGCVVIDEGAERTLFDVLDEIHGLDAEQEDEDELVELEELPEV
jgi:hypothetical protein